MILYPVLEALVKAIGLAKIGISNFAARFNGQFRGISFPDTIPTKTYRTHHDPSYPQCREHSPSFVMGPNRPTGTRRYKIFHHSSFYNTKKDLKNVKKTPTVSFDSTSN
ncbi:Uncharacterized protein HZ326_30706, partial [Fusarium oxysporum f. sp. albedinis]